MLSGLLIVIFALTASPSWASPDPKDPGPDSAHTDSMKKKVAGCVDRQRRVVVETYDNRRLQGVIVEARGDDFDLSSAGRVTTLSYENVKKIKWPSGAWRQVKLVAAAAAVTAAIFGFLVLIGGLKG